jgi:hypothetical protein
VAAIFFWPPPRTDPQLALRGTGCEGAGAPRRLGARTGRDRSRHKPEPRLEAPVQDPCPACGDSKGRANDKGAQRGQQDGVETRISRVPNGSLEIVKILFLNKEC